MNLLRIALQLLLILVSLPVLAQPPVGDGSKIEVLKPGAKMFEDTLAVDGETWWVLFQAAGEEVRLRYAPLVVRPYSATRRNISVAGIPTDEVILLFRGTKELPRGPVSTVFNGSISLAPGTSLDLGSPPSFGFTIEAQPYQQSGSSNQPINTPTDGDYEIRLMQGEVCKQVLFKTFWQSESKKLNTFDEALPRLLWAGDLDKDHKLDLILDLSTHYAGAEYVLFLSTYATSEELVHLVARHIVPTC